MAQKKRTTKKATKRGSRKSTKAKARKPAKATKRTQQATKTTPAREPKPRDPRLPPAGTTITRPYKGTDYEIQVLEQGFRWNGDDYRSLSALASAITGHKSINGFLWFRLTGDAPKREKPAVFKLRIGRRVFKVASIADASDRYAEEREQSGKGASKFPEGRIDTPDGEKLHVSYNARVWRGEGQGREMVFDPGKASKS